MTQNESRPLVETAPEPLPSIGDLAEKDKPDPRPEWQSRHSGSDLIWHPAEMRRRSGERA
jgi:hypothetical protein